MVSAAGRTSMIETPSMGAVDVLHLVMESVNTIGVVEPDGERRSRKMAVALVTGGRIKTRPKRWKDWSTKKK
jgi:hypothetical protein